MNLVRIARVAISTSQQLSRCLFKQNVQTTNFASILSIRHSSDLPAEQKSKLNEEVNKKLMEFFDDKKNWGENEVPHGREWRLPELRIKSNTDLHKLWYILLKEKNMLMSMEHECDEQNRLFPSAERLDKVQMSMKNLEDAVRERNRAYYELETGENGERPGRYVENVCGIKFFYRSFQHKIPRFLNKKWAASHNFKPGGFAVQKFKRLFNEKLWGIKRKARNMQRNEAVHFLKRNPNLDMDILRKKYPDVDFEKLIRNDKFRGHYQPQYEKD